MAIHFERATTNVVTSSLSHIQVYRAGPAVAVKEKIKYFVMLIKNQKSFMQQESVWYEQFSTSLLKGWSPVPQTPKIYSHETNKEGNISLGYAARSSWT